MSNERKPVVVMTATGRAKEHASGSTIREVLEAVHSDHQRGGSDYDRPTKLFIGGECVVTDGLTDIAWEFGQFQEKKYGEVDSAIDEWVKKRFSHLQRGEGA